MSEVVPLLWWHFPKKGQGAPGHREIGGRFYLSVDKKLLNFSVQGQCNNPGRHQLLTGASRGQDWNWYQRIARRDFPEVSLQAAVSGELQFLSEFSVWVGFTHVENLTSDLVPDIFNQGTTSISNLKQPDLVFEKYHSYKSTANRCKWTFLS